MTVSTTSVDQSRMAQAVELAASYRSADEDSEGVSEDWERARAVLLSAFSEVFPNGPRVGVTEDVRDAAILLAESWTKDPEVNPERGCDESLEVLNAWFDLRTTNDVRVLQVSGEILQKRWELSAQWRELRRALYVYERADRIAWAGGDVDDAAKIRLEAAFLLDALARQEERALHDERLTWSRRVPVTDAAGTSVHDTIPPELGSTALTLRREAAELRRALVDRLEDPVVRHQHETSWAYYFHVAQAHVGLRNYTAARQSLETGAAYRPTENERDLQDQARRLIELARMRGIGFGGEGPGPELAALNPPGDFETALDMHRDGSSYEDIARVLKLTSVEAARDAVLEGARLGALSVVVALLSRPDGQPIDEDMINSAFRGKLGLALSGGGFRASLFHIGVLAQLAEQGLLHEIQTISCVSGGSILGAQYYLLVKKLLEKLPDDELKDASVDHYIEIVQSLVEQYEVVTRKNIRARIFLNPFAIAGLWPSPSRRMGRLVHKHLLDEGVQDLRDIGITPKDWPDSDTNPFKPSRHNWQRAHKVPVLILNATSLNTGHNWQFTASSVGEPPTLISSEIESGARLGRVELSTPRRRAWSRIRAKNVKLLRHDEPARHAQTVPISLGEAVAASAAVPGLLQPIQVVGLYPDWLLKLADGGVVDNQGIGGLLDAGADTLFISDASRQLKSSPAPAGGLAPVLRSNSIANNRIRAAQYDELRTRRRSGLVRDFMFVHFNRDLEGPDIAPRAEAQRRRELRATLEPEKSKRRFRLQSKQAASRLRPPDWTQQMALLILGKTSALTLDEMIEEVPDVPRAAVVRAVGSLTARGLVSYDPSSWKYRITTTGRKVASNPVTKYGVARSIQSDLARVRTDLNAFTQAESYALMTSGYLMTKQALAEHKGIGPFRVDPRVGGGVDAAGREAVERWRFLRIAPVMGRPAQGELAKYQYRLERHLSRSSAGMRLRVPARQLSVVLAPLLLIALVAFVSTQDIFSTGSYSIPLPRLVFGVMVLALIAGALAGLWARVTQRAPMRPFAVLAKLSFLVVALVLSMASLMALGATHLPSRGALERFVPRE